MLTTFYSINVSVKRCGGGYGAKLGRSALVSTACAVAAYNMKVPVRMVMKLETNMEAVGKRFPMYGKYEVRIINFINTCAYKNHVFNLSSSFKTSRIKVTNTFWYSVISMFYIVFCNTIVDLSTYAYNTQRSDQNTVFFN